MKWIVDNPNKNDWDYQSLLQVNFEGNLILDIEWNDYWQMFLIQVVANQDWDNPVVEKRLCDDITSLRKNVIECVHNIKKMLVGGVDVGLDAYVNCNCYIEEKTTEPPFDKNLLRFDDGEISIQLSNDMPQEERWDLWDKLDKWEEDCCPHPYRRICDVRIGNLHGIGKFYDAVVKVGGGYHNKYPTLLSIIPSNNGGSVEVAKCLQILAELEDFCNHLEEQTGIFLVDTKTDNTIFSCVESTLISWNKEEKTNVGFNKDGLFVIEADDKASFDCFFNANVKKARDLTDDIVATAKKQFCSKHFTRQILPDEKTVLLIDIATNKQIIADFPSVFPEIEIVEFKIITRPFKSNDFPAIEALRKLSKASIETGNPIYWS